MSYQGRINELIENNKAFATTWKNPGTIMELSANAKATGATIMIGT